MSSAYTTLPVTIYGRCDSLSMLQPKVDIKTYEESRWQSGLRPLTRRFTPGESALIYMATAGTDTECNTAEMWSSYKMWIRTIACVDKKIILPKHKWYPERFKMLKKKTAKMAVLPKSDSTSNVLTSASLLSSLFAVPRQIKVSPL